MIPPVLSVAKVTAEVPDPLHTTSLDGWATCADGLTVMVKVFEGPEQILPSLLKLGVTIIVETTGEVPEFIAAKEEMFPVPLAGSPIEMLSFVQS